MKKSKNKKLAKRKADKYFSLYIRQRDADSNGYVTCCTCGQKFHWKETDAGHFISRDREATRYDERNCHPQCKKDNRFISGRQYEHGLYIDLKYGPGTAEQILQKSYQMCKRGQLDYEIIALELQEKLKKLDTKT